MRNQTERERGVDAALHSRNKVLSKIGGRGERTEGKGEDGVI